MSLFALNRVVNLGTWYGNVLTEGGNALIYDSENQLTGINMGYISIVYDGDGNRVAETVGGVMKRFLVDDLNSTGYAQVVDEVAGRAVTRAYAYGLNLIDENQTINGNWTPSFYGYDGGGTVRQLTSLSGAITDTYEYDAYGSQLSSTGFTPNSYLYRGEQYDANLGFYYLRARYYNPRTGRFISRDPEDGDPGDPKTLHKYLYGSGDPIDELDPTGKAASPIPFPNVPALPVPADPPTQAKPWGASEYVILSAALVGAATVSLPQVRDGIVCRFNQDYQALEGIYANIPYLPNINITWGPCSVAVTHDPVYPLPFPLTLTITPPEGGPGSCPKDEEWHHILPQAERAFFQEECNFPSIDAPGLGMCLPNRCHQAVHGKSNGATWNEVWNQQIDLVWQHACPGKEAVLDFARIVALEFADDLLCQ